MTITLIIVWLLLSSNSGLFMTGSGVQQPFATANGRNQSRAKKALKQIVAGGCAGQFNY